MGDVSVWDGAWGMGHRGKRGERDGDKGQRSEVGGQMTASQMVMNEDNDELRFFDLTCRRIDDFYDFCDLYDFNGHGFDDLTS